MTSLTNIPGCELCVIRFVMFGKLRPIVGYSRVLQSWLGYAILRLTTSLITPLMLNIIRRNMLWSFMALDLVLERKASGIAACGWTVSRSFWPYPYIFAYRLHFLPKNWDRNSKQNIRTPNQSEKCDLHYEPATCSYWCHRSLRKWPLTVNCQACYMTVAQLSSAVTDFKEQYSRKIGT